MVRWLIVPLVLAVPLAGYVYTQQEGGEDDPPAPAPAPPAPADGVTVGIIHDGDSFIVDPGGEVRLIGMNAPDRFECLHDEARASLRELLGGGAVTLEQDATDRDRYDRLLRWARAGDVLVNVAQVERGMALVIDSHEDDRYLPDLQAAQQRARDAGLGIWNPNACGPAASTAVQIVQVEADPRGRDEFNLNGEYAVIENHGPDAVGMTGWKLRDDSTRNRYWFPDGFVLPAGGRVTVHVGQGDDTADALYWNRRGPIWDNARDTALLLDPHGNAVSVCTY